MDNIGGGNVPVVMVSENADNAARDEDASKADYIYVGSNRKSSTCKSWCWFTLSD